VIGDVGVPDDPATASTGRPVPTVARGLSVGCGDFLGPAEVDHVIDVASAVQLVPAHGPAHREYQRVNHPTILKVVHVKELGHLVLYVRNLERSRRFYRDLLGWTEISIPGEEIGFPAAAFSSGRTHHELLLIEVGEDATPIPAGRRVGMYHFGLKIGDTDVELREARDQLVAAGAHLVGTADHTITHSLYIEDPDGNEIELYIDVQPAVWKDDPAAVFARPRPLRL